MYVWLTAACFFVYDFRSEDVVSGLDDSATSILSVAAMNICFLTSWTAVHVCKGHAVCSSGCADVHKALESTNALTLDA